MPVWQVAEAERSLRAAQKDLAETKERLAQLNATLAQLRDQFAAKTAEQLELRAKAEVSSRGGCLLLQEGMRGWTESY